MQQKQTIALIKDTIGHSVRKVIRELGCPMLPTELLSSEQSTFLQNQIQGLPQDRDALNDLVVKNTLTGKVVQVGNTSHGSSLFTVHVPLQDATCVLTLEYYRDEWTLHMIDSVRTRRKQVRQNLFNFAAGALIMAIILIVFFGIRNSTHDAVAEAKAEGYVVLTQDQYQQQVAAGGQATKTTKGQPATGTTGGNSTTTGTGTTGGNTSGNSTGTSSADSGQQMTFTMQDGMSTNDLSTWLLQNGFIQDQAQFDHDLTVQGIDTKIRPKDYVFKKGMSEQDIFNVLQN